MSGVLAIIPARGGSKGVPRKNLRAIGGRPLVVHSILDALNTKSVTRTVVSTDDAEIAAVSRAAGAEIITRPAELSGDTAGSESALLHVLETLKTTEHYQPDLVVFLQATSPIRDAADIDAAIAVLKDRNADSLLSVCPSHEFLWTESGGLGQATNYDPMRRPRRQDMAPQFRENGSLYVCKAEGLVKHKCRLFGRTALYPMSATKSFQIDSLEDFRIAEALFVNDQKTSLAPDLTKIRFLVFDFDGVWTTNQVLVMQDGSEGVLCNRSDGLGLTKLRDAGLPIAVLTAEMNPAPLRRCEKLKIPCVQVPKDKLPALKDMIAAQGIEAKDVCYVGNDVNDIPCMEHVGISVAVADAHPKCLAAAQVVTHAAGGFGAVREVVDWFLEARASRA